MENRLDSCTWLDSQNKKISDQISISQNEVTSALSKWRLVECISDFLAEKWWTVSGKNFYKWELKVSIDHREMIKPSKSISVSEIKNRINKQFKGTEIVKPLPVLAKQLDTFFVVSGIQAISPILFEELPFDDKWYLIHQPSIRLRYLDEISWVEGNWVSFINTNLFKVWCTFEEYLEKVDEIITMLWSIWIYAWNITLELFEKKDKWNDRNLSEIWINFKFWNLEMGEAVYVYDFQQNSRENIKFCDIWFWLERIMYARNNISNYFQQYDVDLDVYSEREVEVIKALVLMMSDGIQGEIKSHWAWFRYKQLIKSLDKNKNYFKLIVCFYKYRSQFLEFPSSIEETTFSLLNEMNKYV